MKRIDIIYKYIQDFSLALPKDKLTGRVGIDATALAEALQILRSNASRELNALHRMGKIIKFNGRPVLYFDRQYLETALQLKLPDTAPTLDSIETTPTITAKTPTKTGFDTLIGASDSLKKPVEQSKAAILYPPNGLHTLIVGQTGVGKTLFARLMYEYGIEMGRFKKAAPFITFNCADYYNNPQLLIAHIFGHAKASFTGADSAKAGLVEAADNGILFLDEIHRLPPEGQEMIFYFMDTGTFNRLGETERTRTARVFIICATTENPDSVLTKTFIRRIPNIITLPPLSDRTVKEKFYILKLLFTQEALRINRPLNISADAVKALIGSIGPGNIGQLKSNIKLLCAQAFLHSFANDTSIEISYETMPEKLKSGLIQLSENRSERDLLSHYISDELSIKPNQSTVSTDDTSEIPFNLYRMLEDKISMLEKRGLNKPLINEMIKSDVNLYIKSFYNNETNISLTIHQRLAKIIDDDIINFTEQIALIVSEKITLCSSDRFIYAFAMHLSVFFKRIKLNKSLQESTIRETIDRSSPIFQTALIIKKAIEDYYHVEVPANEVDYFAIMLNSLSADDTNDKIQIIVAMHGVDTATSITAVAKKLFNNSAYDNLAAFNMPLENSPPETLENIITYLKTRSCSKGVLMLTDMGSLCNIGRLISERLNIQVKTIDMVSTPLILEAMRKADIAGINLTVLFESLRNFKGYNQDIDSTSANDLPEAIVAICSSGQGTAVKLVSLLNDLLSQITSKPIKLFTASVVNMQKKIAEVQKTHKVIAAVGLADPKMDMPFIPLEKIISGEVENILRQLTGAAMPSFSADQPKDTLILKSFLKDSLGEMLIYLNPQKIIDTLLRFDHTLEKSLNLTLTNPLRIRLLVHTGCALERMVTGNGLQYDEQEYGEIDTQKFNCVKKAALIFSSSIQLTLTDDEICFITAQLQ